MEKLHITMIVTDGLTAGMHRTTDWLRFMGYVESYYVCGGKTLYLLGSLDSDEMWDRYWPQFIGLSVSLWDVSGAVPHLHYQDDGLRIWMHWAIGRVDGVYKRSSGPMEPYSIRDVDRMLSADAPESLRNRMVEDTVRMAQMRWERLMG